MTIGLAQTDDERIHAVGAFYVDLPFVVGNNGLCDRKSETEMSGCGLCPNDRNAQTIGYVPIQESHHRYYLR